MGRHGSTVTVFAKVRRLFRRRPLTGDEFREQEEQRLAAEQLRSLKMSQRAGYAAEVDASKRGGKF